MGMVNLSLLNLGLFNLSPFNLSLFNLDLNLDLLKTGLPDLAVFHDIEIVGFYVSPLLLWSAAALIPFALLRWLFDRYGLYRFIWHRSLFNLALYVLLVGGAVLIGNWSWLL